MNSLLIKIPGFRSGKRWRSIIVSVVYLSFFVVLLTTIIPTSPTLALDELKPTNKDSSSITGKTGWNKQVYLLKSGSVVQSTKADSEGNFVFALNKLEQGNYAYTIEACDTDKRDRCTRKNTLLVVDLKPPTKPAAIIPQNLPDNSGSEAANSSVVFNPTKYKVKVLHVTDGDTIKVEGDKVIRYIGIDTPETVHPSKPVQCYGKEASAKNKELVEGKEVMLEKDVSELDKYGRKLRYVWLGDTLVNEYLVREGYAHSSSYPPDVKYQDRFVEAQRLARQEAKGLWGEVCNTSNVGDATPTSQPTATQP